MAKEKKICPKCHTEYTDVPATSRFDEGLEICKYCGTREALQIVGMNSDEIEKVIDAIKEAEKQHKITPAKIKKIIEKHSAKNG